MPTKFNFRANAAVLLRIMIVDAMISVFFSRIWLNWYKDFCFKLKVKMIRWIIHNWQVNNKLYGIFLIFCYRFAQNKRRRNCILVSKWSIYFSLAVTEFMSVIEMFTLSTPALRSFLDGLNAINFQNNAKQCGKNRNVIIEHIRALCRIYRISDNLCVIYTNVKIFQSILESVEYVSQICGVNLSPPIFVCTTPKTPITRTRLAAISL